MYARMRVRTLYIDGQSADSEKNFFVQKKGNEKVCTEKKTHANKISKTHLFVNKIQIHFSIRFSEVALQIFLLKLFWNDRTTEPQLNECINFVQKSTIFEKCSTPHPMQHRIHKACYSQENTFELKCIQSFDGRSLCFVFPCSVLCFLRFIYFCCQQHNFIGDRKSSNCWWR